MLKIQMEKVGNLQEQMQKYGNSKKKSEANVIRHTVTEIKNAIDVLTSQYDSAKEKIAELDYMPIKTSETESQREKKKNESTEHNTQELCNNYKCITYMQVEYQKQKKDQKENEFLRGVVG